MESKKYSVNVGSRNSQLALIQTNLVMSKLTEFYANNPDRLEKVLGQESHDSRLDFNLISMTTTGDQILDRPLKDVSTTALFTRELEAALLAGKVDFVVHSLKDLPTTLPEGCSIAAVLTRDNREDTLILNSRHKGKVEPADLVFGKNDFKDKKVVIGTSSQRRIAMLRRCNPNVICTDIRGNLNTRFRKLDDEQGQYDAIILARAGLDRMKWTERSSCLMTDDNGISDWCYAVGQGAIAVECRTKDKLIIDLLRPLTNLETLYEVIAERALMKKLEAGCSAPLGVRTTWSKSDQGSDIVYIKAIVLSIDGKDIVQSDGSTTLSESDHPVGATVGPDTTDIVLSEEAMAEGNVRSNMITCASLGVSVADKLIEMGCVDVMDLARK